MLKLAAFRLEILNSMFHMQDKRVSVTSSPSPLTFTLICYNSLGQRTLTVSDMNLNGQIDWCDTDRIVSNDTRYVSLDGDWWRESSSWQTRQNGSSELTLMGRSRCLQWDSISPNPRKFRNMVTTF